MISEKVKNQLLNATDRQTFVEIAEFNGLKTRDSLKSPVIFAFENGDYKNRLSSAMCCNRCGTFANIEENTIVENVCYCSACDNRRSLRADNLDIAALAHGRGIGNDPFLLSDRDVPMHVLRGEQHDDKMAMFRNEY